MFDPSQWPAYLALLGAALVGYTLVKRQRAAARQQQTAATALNALTQRLTAVESRLHRALEENAEQARHVAMLELHLHQNSAGAELRNNPKSGGQAAGMTERRHRVMVLARRGMNTEMIAETLGVPKGEIELIISLSSLKAAA